MEIFEFLWLERFVEKLEQKHNVSTEEVEEVFNNGALIRFWQKGTVAGEDLYLAYGQADSGRYLVVFFVDKGAGLALPISARDMTRSERRYYNAHR